MKDRVIQSTSERVVELAEILDVDISNLDYAIDKPPPGVIGGTLRISQRNHERELALTFDERDYFGPFGEIPVLKQVSESLRDWNLAHEMYHLRQVQKFPHSLQKTLEASKELGKTGDATKYTQDKGEYAARLFALAYVQRSAHGGKSGVASILGNLELGAFKLVRNMSEKVQNKLDASTPSPLHEVK